MWKKSSFRESIFFKILLVFILAGMADIVVLRFFYRNFVFDERRREHRGLNWSEYGELLAASLPQPPTQQDLAQLSTKLHLRIRYEGSKAEGWVPSSASEFVPKLSVASSPDVPDFTVVEKNSEVRYSLESPNVRRYGDFLSIETKLAGGRGRYLFLLEGDSPIDAHAEFILFLLVTLLLILTSSYIAIRRILSPIKEIERGVKEVSKGNLDVSIESRSSDELGRLSRSFNRMTEQVRTMIGLKEQLLLDVSHEFRSPLTRIKVALEVPGAAARTSIDRALKELDAMLTELLESNRLSDSRGRLKTENTDLVGMLRELVSLYEDHPPGVRLKAEVSSLICPIDPARMQTALRNLVENAIKYSNEQTRPVEIFLAKLGASRSPDGREQVQVTIKDHGIGIPKEDLALIFEPFYRVDRSRMKLTGGYGLGLALCQKIITAHGGSIDVVSEVGQGSAFTIRLPLAEV